MWGALSLQGDLPCVSMELPPRGGNWLILENTIPVFTGIHFPWVWMCVYYCCSNTHTKRTLLTHSLHTHTHTQKKSLCIVARFSFLPWRFADVWRGSWVFVCFVFVLQNNLLVIWTREYSPIHTVESTVEYIHSYKTRTNARLLNYFLKKPLTL